jgi:hypothetical protein
MTLRRSGQASNFESLDGKLAEPMIKTGLSALGGARISPASLRNSAHLESDTQARCAIAALGSDAPTPLAETPQPSHRRWWVRDCFGLDASRRVGDVFPIPLRRFLRVL